jgi:predicted phage terminase large subunit-like protein
MSQRRKTAVPSADAIEAEWCSRSLARFVRVAWGVVDPAPLIWNWHLDAICDRLQAVTEGKLKRLVISVPPGHAKSMLVSVLWPAWVWGFRTPSWKALFASYSDDLVVRDATKSRELLRSPWFRSRKRCAWSISEDQDRKDYFRNTEHGERMCISVTGRGTGFRGDAVVVDDPMNALDSYSEAKRTQVIRWWRETMPSRLNDLAQGAKVIIAQRLHEMDLPGYVLQEGGFEHLVLPTEYDAAPCYVRTRNGPCESCARGDTKDPRHTPGELLFPAKFGAAVIKQAKKDMGSSDYGAQHQQRPVPAGGAMLKESWFRKLWRRPGEPPMPLGQFEEGIEVKVIDPDKDRFDVWAMCLDATFKEASDTDWVAIGVGAKRGPDLFLVDLWWERAGFLKTLEAFQGMHARWPRAVTKLIEDKANGPAIIDTLRAKVPGILPVQPLGGKVARVGAASPYFEAGNVWLPMHAPWRQRFVGEACAFPSAPHDDGIDMLSYLVLRLLGGGAAGDRLRQLVRW